MGEGSVSDYVICTTQRSGSTFFCECLTRTGLLGAPGEWLVFLEVKQDIVSERLRPLQSQPLEEAVRFQAKRQRDKSHQAITGWKIMGSTMRKMSRSLRAELGHDRTEAHNDIAVFQLLNKELNAPKFIFFERANKIAQGISRAVLQETQISHVRDGADQKLLDEQKARLVIKDLAITQNIVATANDESAWKQFFVVNDIEPHVVTYEDFIADVDGSVRAVGTFLGFAEPLVMQPAEARLRKTRGAFERELAKAYLWRLIKKSKKLNRLQRQGDAGGTAGQGSKARASARAAPGSSPA